MPDIDPNSREPGPQPDPMLRRGKIEPVWLWMGGIVIAGIVVATLFAISPPDNHTARNAPAAPQTAGKTAPPSVALAPGRQTTGAASQTDTSGSNQK
jgi:hypothetical protein